MRIGEIELLAQAEIDAEERRAAIEAAKERIRLRKGRPWWRLVLPFTIKFQWRD